MLPVWYHSLMSRLSSSTAEKHVNAVFTQLPLPDTRVHRRVAAVLKLWRGAQLAARTMDPVIDHRLAESEGCSRHEGMVVEAVKYTLMYRFGLTPWEHYAEVAQASIAATLEHESAERMGRPLGRALDVGCGRGVHSAALARLGWDVVGIDLVRQAVEAARRAGVKGARFEVADATRLHQAALGRFDFFLDVGCFQGLDASGRLAMGAGVTALANPGASLLMLAFGPTLLHRLTEGVTRDQVTSAFPGWRLLSTEPADTRGLGWPLNRSQPMWYRFGRRDSS